MIQKTYEEQAIERFLNQKKRRFSYQDRLLSQMRYRKPQRGNMTLREEASMHSGE